MLPIYIPTSHAWKFHCPTSLPTPVQVNFSELTESWYLIVILLCISLHHKEAGDGPFGFPLLWHDCQAFYPFVSIELSAFLLLVRSRLFIQLESCSVYLVSGFCRVCVRFIRAVCGAWRDRTTAYLSRLLLTHFGLFPVFRDLANAAMSIFLHLASFWWTYVLLAYSRLSTFSFMIDWFCVFPV